MLVERECQDVGGLVFAAVFAVDGLYVVVSREVHI